MIKISAVIITLNEEKNLARCLDSLRGIADEIVVIDSFSSDRTQAICEEHKVRFIQNKFEGHIQQKNFAVDSASHDWVLGLDADEMLDAELQKSILKIKQKPDFQAYSMNRLNIYCGKAIRHSGWYPDRKLRLWNRQIGRWGGSNPHDRVIPEAGTAIQRLKGDLWHYSYDSVQAHVRQQNYFTDIMAKEAVSKGKKGSLIRIMISPLYKFIHHYFIRLGFLDGYYGLVVCSITAFSTFIKYVKIKELSKK